MKSKEIIKRFLVAENRRDWVTMAQYVDDSVEYSVVNSVAPSTQGKVAYIQKMQETYAELADWRFTIVDIEGSEQSVKAVFDGRGHFTGEYQGDHYANVPLHLRAVCIFKVQDGLITEIRDHWDQAGFESQLSNGVCEVESDLLWQESNN